MRYLSVCSGIEAATVAWHPLGFTPVAFSEVEKFPSAVLAHHYPNTPNLGDMTKIDGYKFRGNCDLLVGGTPCQSFSVAGLRRGLADDRGNLALHFMRLAHEIRPRYVLWENVPGALSSSKGRDFGAIVGALEELGYGWAYRTLDAQYFGLAQRRKRVFLVGCLGDPERAREILFEREGLQGHPPPSREARQDPTGGVTHSLRGEGFDASEDGTGRGTPLVASHWDGEHPHPTLNQSHNDGGIGQSNQELFSPRGGGLVPQVLKIRAGCEGGGKGALIGENQAFTLATGNDQTLFAPTLGIDAEFNVREELQCTLKRGGQGGRIEAVAIRTANTSANGHGIAEEVTHTLDQAQGQAVAFAQNSRDEVRLIGGDVSHAGALAAEAGMKQQTYIASAFDARQSDVIQYGDKTGPLDTDGHTVGVNHGYTVRRLTPTECERLQGFPDGYTRIPWRGKPAGDCPDGPRYKALGNSMAVPVMAWIGRRIAEQDTELT